MDNKIIELLSEEIRETRNLTIETRKLAEAAMSKANAAWEEVSNSKEEMKNSKEEMKNSKRQADAAWELVVITRNEINRPIWKKWFGIN